MDYTIGPYRGTEQLGCQRQVSRARERVSTALEVKDADNIALSKCDLKTIIAPTSVIFCGCKIAENGCIDPSECQQCHRTCPVPTLIRWCDSATCLLIGSGHLIFWSGWARPSVLHLSGRFPTVSRVRQMFAASNARTLHTSYRFDYKNRKDDFYGDWVVDIIPKKHTEKEYYKARDLLANLPGTWRFGQHSNVEFPIQERNLT